MCVLQAPCRLSWLREFGAAVPTAVHQRAEATKQAEAGLGGTAVLGAECQWGTIDRRTRRPAITGVLPADRFIFSAASDEIGRRLLCCDCI